MQKIDGNLPHGTLPPIQIQLARVSVLRLADLLDAADLFAGRIEPAENVAWLDLQLGCQFFHGNS